MVNMLCTYLHQHLLLLIAALLLHCITAQVVIKNAIAVAGIVGDIETTPQFPVTNYKITRGIFLNTTVSTLNGTRGNRTARTVTPRTNRTALAVRLEAAAAHLQEETAVSQSAGHFVGVGLALPQQPQTEFAIRHYRQQVGNGGLHQANAAVVAAVSR
eukprot:GHRQ01032887.1.p2 GENE.GHRQ01032887.1~~GHRQ01032887.1.p2  ORF type:complete len:158 (+),score=39.48 GHRQ01032887.1:577-1050(+)